MDNFNSETSSKKKSQPTASETKCRKLECITYVDVILATLTDLESAIATVDFTSADFKDKVDKYIDQITLMTHSIKSKIMDI